MQIAQKVKFFPVSKAKLLLWKMSRFELGGRARFSCDGDFHWRRWGGYMWGM